MSKEKGCKGLKWVDRFDWSEANIERLRGMVADGCTGQEIAEALGGGLTRNAVIGKASRLGLRWPEKGRGPRVPSPQEAAWQRDEPKLRQMHAQGWPARAIAKALDRPLTQVRDKAERLGLAFERGPTAGGTYRPRKLVPVPPAQAAAGAEPVHFLDRRPGQCVWPLWEPPDRIGFVCGGITAEHGGTYCAEHQERAWVAPRGRATLP